MWSLSCISSDTDRRAYRNGTPIGLRQASPVTPNAHPDIENALAHSAPLVRSRISIDGMTCATCTGAVSRALLAIEGVKEATISVLLHNGVLVHEESIDTQTLIRAIEDVGYDAQFISSEVIGGNPAAATINHRTLELQRTDLGIEGMTCASCTSTIEQAVKGLHGVQTAVVDLLGHKAVVVHSSEVTAEDIRKAITEAGYPAVVSHSAKEESASGRQQSARRAVSLRIRGIYAVKDTARIDSLLQQAGLTHRWSTTGSSTGGDTLVIEYIPYQPWTIRDIVHNVDQLSPAFTAEIVKPINLSTRGREIQRKELRSLLLSFIASVLFVIPTFIIALVAMVLLPNDSPMAMYFDRPVWGAAALGTVIVWPLATIVQFGIGRIFYRRAFSPLRPFIGLILPAKRKAVGARRRWHWKWMTLITFGNMDLLVAMSTSVAYFSSLAMLIIDARRSQNGGSIGSYFADSVYLIMFILAGRCLEAYAKTRTGDAITALGSLRPDTAILVPADAVERTPSGNLSKTEPDASKLNSPQRSDPEVDQIIPVDLIEIGDLIRILPGSLPPADGIVAQGETTFDESTLTGESIPVSKVLGDSVYTGTTNTGGAITIRVSGVSGETMLDRIISAVSDAAAHKAPIEKLAEQLTTLFVPGVIYFAIAVLIIWLALALSGAVRPSGEQGGGIVFWALEFAIATLIVACPCGIGLAVPCATAVGNGLTAQLGVVAAGGGEAFVGATQVSTIVFDKTGTLTLGKMAVTNEDWSPELQDEQREVISEAVRQIEAQSTHPLAQSIALHLASSPGSRPVEIMKSTEIAGSGILSDARFEGSLIRFAIGNVGLMEDQGVEVHARHRALLNRWADEAKSVVLVSAELEPGSGQSIVCAFGVADAPRPSTTGALAALRKRGVRCVMLSGDHIRTAMAVGRELGFSPEDIQGGVSPEGKASYIRSVQSHPRPQLATQGILASLWPRRQAGSSEKEVVMFIGDGLNDAPALSAADVAVGMGHGSQTILSSADFVLLSSDLGVTPHLLDVAHRVARRQRLNLVWACLFNIVAIPFAAGVFYGAGGIRLTPVWAAIVMACSSST